ncbi:MAG: hypothetical protein JO219_01780 [Candidatus Eremiobacteraeota bacterium]|nr:hypothetical protein [Candidatus Eremiobacteraeota bacterium]
MSADPQIDLIMSDLRRAASAGTTGDASERAPGVLVDAGTQAGVERFRPSQAPLAVAIDGPGLFALAAGSQTVYSRLGDFRIAENGFLVDSSGRTALGFSRLAGTTGQVVAPIQVPGSQGHFDSYRIDADGTLVGIEHRMQRRRGRVERDVPIAQIAIALFPAPHMLARVDDTTLVATAAAGTPSLGLAQQNGRGSLRVHVVAAGVVDLQADLRKLWMARRMREVELALASASDACMRTALGLVR